MRWDERAIYLGTGMWRILAWQKGWSYPAFIAEFLPYIGSRWQQRNIKCSFFLWCPSTWALIYFLTSSLLVYLLCSLACLLSQVTVLFLKIWSDDWVAWHLSYYFSRNITHPCQRKDVPPMSTVTTERSQRCTCVRTEGTVIRCVSSTVPPSLLSHSKKEALTMELVLKQYC